MGYAYAVSTFQLPSFINDSIEMCNIGDEVTQASVLMKFDDIRCDRSAFCSKFASVQWDLAKTAQERIKADISEDKRPKDFVGFVDWLQQQANRIGEIGLNFTKDDHKEISAGEQVLYGSNQIYGLYEKREMSTFKVPHCHDDMEKWRSNAATWLNQASAFNTSDGFSATSPINSNIRLIVSPNGILQQLNDLIAAFRLGNITQVSDQRLNSKGIVLR
jgi:hypothetical protein